MIIKVENNQHVGAPVTYLSNVMSAGTTTLSLKNTDQFTSGWAVQLGNTGEERAELKIINSVASGTALTVTLATGLRYEHPTDTPVYAIKYDKLIFKRSTTGTAGTAVAITSGTVSITPDSTFTQFDDTSGSTSYAYKTSFWSTGLTAESADSDWFEATGASFYSLGQIRDRIRKKILNSDSLDDADIDRWINEWLEKMTNTAINVNEDYSLGTTEVGFSGTVQENSITAADFKQVRRAWHTGDGSTWYKMTKMDFTDFEPSEAFNDTAPFYYMKGDSTIGRQPHDNSGTIGLTYYKLNPILSNESDLLPVPMRGYTASFVRYGEAQAKRLDDKFDQAQALEKDAEADRFKFSQEISSRNKSGPTYIDFVEGMPNDDVFL